MCIAVITALLACSDDKQADSLQTIYQATIPSPPMVIAPVVAATADGSAWLVWTEGDGTQEALATARTDAQGQVSAFPLAAAIVGAQRDAQIVVSGAPPVVAWREYSNNGIRVRAAAHIGSAWQGEFVQAASADGGLDLVAMADGTVSLVWQQVGSNGSADLVASRRSPTGVWAAPTHVASLPAGMAMGAPRHAAAVDGTLQVIWTEAPNSTGTPTPQLLMASRYDVTTDAWSAAAPLDAVNGPYFNYAIVSTGADRWMAVWATTSLSQPASLLAKRAVGSAWGAAPSRIDRGDDHTVSALALKARGSTVVAVWAGLAELIAPSALRAAHFDDAAQAWAAPVTLQGMAQGFPVVPRLAVAGAGSAVVVWGVSQGGSGGPFLAASTGSSGWRAPSLLDERGAGLAADVALVADRDFVSAWYRPAAQGRSDIIVRRMRIAD